MQRENIKLKISKFTVGELVRVRSKEEISKALDSHNQHGGCLFMEGMWGYCGRSLKIIKIVNHFFDEYQYKMFKPNSSIYLLEGSICNGNIEEAGPECDRSCYIMWHEEWLESL